MKRFTTAPDAKGKRVLLGLLAAVFWIAVWQAVSMAVGQELLVPAPLKVAGTLWEAAGIRPLLESGGLLPAAGGGRFPGRAVIVGCAVAVLTVRFPLPRALLSPLLRVIRRPRRILYHSGAGMDPHRPAPRFHRLFDGGAGRLGQCGERHTGDG